MSRRTFLKAFFIDDSLPWGVRIITIVRYKIGTLKGPSSVNTSVIHRITTSFISNVAAQCDVEKNFFYFRQIFEFAKKDRLQIYFEHLWQLTYYAYDVHFGIHRGSSCKVLIVEMNILKKIIIWNTQIFRHICQGYICRWDNLFEELKKATYLQHYLI